MSPSGAATTFEKLIVVASGIGITAGVTVMEQLKDRPVSLIWCCRDVSLVKFFVQKFEFNPQGFILIFYTGKTSLRLDDVLPRNMCIVAGRPKMKPVVVAVMRSVEEGKQVKAFKSTHFVMKSNSRAILVLRSLTGVSRPALPSPNGSATAAPAERMSAVRRPGPSLPSFELLHVARSPSAVTPACLVLKRSKSRVESLREFEACRQEVCCFLRVTSLSQSDDACNSCASCLVLVLLLYLEVAADLCE